MKKVNRPLALTIALLTGFAVVWASFSPSTAADKKPKKDRAVERTRKTVRMLDDLYKTAVVAITTHYVNDTDDLSAGSAANHRRALSRCCNRRWCPRRVQRLKQIR